MNGEQRLSVGYLEIAATAWLAS